MSPESRALRAARAALPCVLAAAALSCSPPAVSLRETGKAFKSQDYERVFERWTRGGEVYNLDTLENSLKVSATFLSWEMRQAYVARYASDYGLDAKQKEELLAQERAALDERNEFLVAATATDQKWAQFLRADSPWRITLHTSRGDEQLPAKIEKIAKPSPQIRAYFPYITIYREVFRFFFPLEGEAAGTAVLDPWLESFSLVFAGALGRVELKWKVATSS